MLRSLKAFAVIAALSAAVVPSLPAEVAASPLPRPEVLSASATPSTLGPYGGKAQVTGRVKNASSCQLELLSSQSFPVVYSHNATTSCRSGAFSAFVTIGPNPSLVKRTVAFALVARNGSYSFVGRFYISLGALSAPEVLSASATPSALGPYGGKAQVTGRVKNASSCQLELLSSQSFPVVYSHNATTSCRSGAFSAFVTIGPNPSLVKRTVAFALVARNGSYSFVGRFYISLGALSAPEVLSASATPSALGPYGGKAQVTGRVKNASSCQLELLSSQSFPVVYSHNATTSCRSGAFSAFVTIGPNPSLVKRTVAFALVARNGSYSFVGRFYISLGASGTAHPPPSAGAPDPYAAVATGYDVSWPQCSPRGSPRLGDLPPGASFAVVGVNNGRVNGFNSCFDAEAAWAGQDLSVYIILQPAPGGEPVPYESTGPQASCAASSSECEGYDWGYNYASADIAFVTAQGYNPKVWWLDIETAEGWPISAPLQAVNAAIVEGALAAIKAAGDIGGVYCTWYQWGEITGSYLPPGGLPIWVAGAANLSGGRYSAESYCKLALSPGDPSTLHSLSIGFAGGAPWLVQFGYGTGIDHDYSCG